MDSESDQLHEISRRLVTRTAVIDRRLGQRLEAIRSAYELDARALLSSHRQIRELADLAVAPAPVEFWSVTANPRAQAMVEAASHVIDEELEVFDHAIRRFQRSAAAAAEHPNHAKAGYTAVLQECVNQLSACRLDPEPINRLGARWQARLRRAATLSLFPRLLLVSANRNRTLIAQAEVDLLDRPPWAHDDRLLSAFELAHADIRIHLRSRLNGLSVVVPRRPGGDLVTAG